MRQIVFLMTDTTRADMLGCYGNSDMKTPYLDALAAKGLRYENAYTCQPVCGPARSAIFTGTFPHSNGMVTNSVALGQNVKTVGQRLTDEGIHCAYIGKWHLDGGDYFGNGVCPEGWDENYWYDMRCYLEEMSDRDRVRSRRDETSFDPDMTAEFTYAHKCSDRAVDFLSKHHQEDFFLTVSYDEPHGPSLCPAPFNTMYENMVMPDNENYGDDLSDKPLMQRLWAQKYMDKDKEELRKLNDFQKLFLGCNSFVDSEIGRVLEAVEKYCPNAMVIFTSDHGDMMGSHRLFSKNSSAYKEVANIPLIIKGGAVGVVKAPASHIDLTPTILEYMGAELSPVLEGKSMLAQIENPEVAINDYVFTEFTRYEVDHDGFGGLQMMRAVTDGRYKLVIHLLDTDEMYDMQEDPSEMRNLVHCEETAEIRNRLHDAILDHMNRTRDLYRGYQWACRPWRPEKQPTWENDYCTRQREESERYEKRQFDYDTGLPMVQAVRRKRLDGQPIPEVKL